MGNKVSGQKSNDMDQRAYEILYETSRNLALHDYILNLSIQHILP